MDQFRHLLGDEEGRDVLKLPGTQRGFSIVELMIAMAVAVIVLAIGAPSFSLYLQNTQIKNAAEITMAGINLARAEAVRRNMSVRFQLVSTLTNTCTLSNLSLNWVVSLGNPTSLCATAPADPSDANLPTATDPKIVQKQSGTEGMRNVTIATTGGNTLVFSGLGRVTGAGITQVDFSNIAGACEHAATPGPMRCLRIMVTTGGLVKMCDPKVPVNVPPVDPRECAL